MNVAFVGPMHSGKTTAAMHLVEHHGYTRLSLADPVKESVILACNSFIWRYLESLPERQDRLGMHGRPAILIDRVELEERKEVFRPILQWWGTEFAREYLGNENIWVDALLHRVKHTVGPVVCDDVRFTNEANALRAAGFRLIRIDRPQTSREERNAPSLHQHSSETSSDNIAVDHLIYNTSLARLSAALDTHLST